MSLGLFIAEDEPPARERLIEAVARVAPGARVLGWSDSVQGTAAWLAGHVAPDLLLLDIQLADGLSLELFRSGQLSLPVIFTTAYDRFAIDAFQALAVDYLLKPVSEAALGMAFAKAARLRQQFAPGVDVLARLLDAARTQGAVFRQRLVGRKGNQFHALEVARVAWVVSVDKLSFAVMHDGNRYLLEQPLSQLEGELDPAAFFRVSRQLLVALPGVRRFAAAGRGRLKLELAPAGEGEVLISQERAAAFRAWIGGAPSTLPEGL
jgi:DNA-binding LytR/AlgR family response regulator